MLTFTTRLRTKLLLSFFGASLLVAVVAALAIAEQINSSEAGAATAAEYEALAFSYSNIEDYLARSKNLQKKVESLHRLHHRDITVIDMRKMRVADSDQSDIGNIYEH